MYLVHRDHKYIDRTWKNGKWRYTYPSGKRAAKISKRLGPDKESQKGSPDYSKESADKYVKGVGSTLKDIFKPLGKVNDPSYKNQADAYNRASKDADIAAERQKRQQQQMDYQIEHPVKAAFDELKLNARSAKVKISKGKQWLKKQLGIS